MKQSKKLLCVLIAMIMTISCLTIGVSAYKTDYSTPGKGYNNILDPVFTPEQGASAILDFIDDMLAPLGEKINIDKLGVEIHIFSLDSTFDSLNNIFTSTVYKLGTIFDLGVIEHLHVSIPKDTSIRRRNPSLSDFNFFNKFLEFLQSNSQYLCQFVDNSIDLGIIQSWDLWDNRKELPMLNDLHGYINEMVYGLIIDETADFDKNATLKAQVDAMKLDNIIQDFINNRCLKFVCDMFAEVKNGVASNPVAEFLGIPINEKGELTKQRGLVDADVFPSLTAAKLSINNVSTYQLIRNIYDALINDVVVKFAGELILDALDIKPENPNADTSYINIAINLFVTAKDLGLAEDAGDDEVIPAFLATQGCPNPANPKPIDKVNCTLKYILGAGTKILSSGEEGIKKFVRFIDDGNGNKLLQLDQELTDELSNYIKMLLPMLNGFVPDTFSALTSQQIDNLEAMDDEATFAFMVQYLLENLIKDVKFDFEEDCSTVKELATWTLVNVAAELLPTIDFEAKIENGTIDPNSDDCLDIAAAVIAYYLNGELGMNIRYEGVTFENLLGQAFDFFLDKYAVLFTKTTYTNSSDPNKNLKVWHDLDETVNQWIPLTNLVCNLKTSDSAAPGLAASECQLRDLVMNRIINSVLDFDLNGLLSIIGRMSSSNTKAEFNKPLTKVLVNLVARILNGVFHLKTESKSNLTSNDEQKALIVPYAYQTLDQLTTVTSSASGVLNGTGLKRTAEMLLDNITNITGSGSLVEKSADLIAELIGVIDLDNFEYMKVYYTEHHKASETYSIKDLRALYNKLSLADNTGKKYYEDDYEFFHMVDFAPWSYLKFKSSLADARDIVNRYAAYQSGDGEAPTRNEITYITYVLKQYQSLLAANQRAASDYQLNKTINKYEARFAELIAPIQSGNPELENKDGSGNDLYTARTYNAFKQAWLFAKKVMTEFAPYKSSGTASQYRQSKINEARRQLIDAVQRLKAFVPLADYTDLDLGMITVQSMEGSPSSYTKESVNRVIEAYKKAFNTDRDYDIDEQSIVDNATEELQEALNELKEVTKIELFDTDTQHLDLDNGLIYGFTENFYSKQEAEDWGDDFPIYFMSMYGSVIRGTDYEDNEYEPYVNIVPTSKGNGTGSRLQVIFGDPYDEEVPRKVAVAYDMVIFGDVNGDAIADGMDAVIMRMHSGFMFERELTPTSILTAGDLNCDGAISSSDAKTAANHALGLRNSEIDQCPQGLVSKQITFMDLIEQAS
ncbi:MAG: hypothetical protein KBT46_08680 [Ruminococcus sp.]|nr:hypothetical protein [Candidatus Copronaster equi]